MFCIVMGWWLCEYLQLSKVIDANQNYSEVSPHTSHDVKILALCEPMMKKSMETEFWRNEKKDFNLCLQGG